MSVTSSPDSNIYTGLILLSGVDSPGIAQALFDALSPFAVTVLDIEQVVIRDRLILTVLISLNANHAQSIEEDLDSCATALGVDIAVSFAEADSSVLAAKSGLLHVIAIGKAFKPSALSAITAAITDQGANIERVYRTGSDPLMVIEFIVAGASQLELRAVLAPVSLEHQVDIGVQPAGVMKSARKLLVMDVDSTLIEQEVIELLAAKAGVEAEVREITQAAMRGELDFAQSLESRVSLLKGLPESVIAEVRQEISLSPGAEKLVQTLLRLGHEVAVVTGGFIEVIGPLLNELGIKKYRANSLEIADGVLTGRTTGTVIDRAGKAQALKDFADSSGIDLEQTIAIGDGANDLEMLAVAGLGIAFNAKPAVRQAADIALNQPSLDAVLYLIGIEREDGEIQKD